MHVLLATALSWFIPFAASFTMFQVNPETGVGELAIDKLVFQNVMTVIGALCFSLLYQSAMGGDYTNKPRILKTAAWMCLGNVALDVGILLPLSQMGLHRWFQEIGNMYFILFFMFAVFALSLRPYRARRKVHKFVVVAEPLLCLFMRFVLGNLQDDWPNARVSFLMLTGGLVGAMFLLAINTNFLAFSVLFTIITSVVEYALVHLQWTLQEYALRRGIRLAGIMLALGLLGHDFERKQSQRQAAVAGLVREMGIVKQAD